MSEKVMIEAAGLSKFYGSFVAVQDISFNIPEGQIVAFLGPNGAGKSTTMKILSGYLGASAGTAAIAGLDVRRDRLAMSRHLGYLPENGPWSAPYDPVAGTGEEGTEITSPGPRQYVQIRADFISEDLNSAVALENLSFTFTSPPLAREVVGEVFPREVAGATDVPFVFAVRTEMEAGLQGFDAIEVRSDQPIRSVQGIEILDGDQNRILEQSFTVEDAPTEEEDAAIQELDERRFVVRFPQVRESGTIVKVRFVGRMLSFSNTFKGRVLLIEEEAFQDVLSGDAAYLGDDDAPGRSGVTVLSPQLTTGRLVRNLEVVPVVSPNGDGIRDRASISFEVVTIVGQAGINAAVFDLSGRRIRQLLARPGTNGLYDPQRFGDLAWDGRDASGQLVAPGVYVVRVEVQADARRTGAARVIGVVY